MTLALLISLALAAESTASPETPEASAPAPAVPAPVATPDTWPSWRGNAAQTGRAPGTLKLPLAATWTLDTGAEALVSSPVVDETRVYLGSKDGRLLAVDRVEGTVVWSVETEAAVEAPPLRVGELVVFGSRDRKLRAVKATDGTLAWTFDAKAELVGAATFVPARDDVGPGVLVGGYDGRMHLLDLATGMPRWAYETGSYIYGSAAIQDDKAVFGGCDGFVHTVSLATGEAVARTEVGAYVGASPAWPEGDHAYVGHFGNRVIQLDATKGTLGWSYRDRDFPYLSSPAITDELVILGARDKVVRALERKTGEVWWFAPTRGKVDSSPVVIGQHVVVGSADGRVYVLSLEDGSEQFTWDAGEAITASPALAGGSVYIGTEGGTLVALGPPPAKGAGKDKASGPKKAD